MSVFLQPVEVDTSAPEPEWMGADVYVFPFTGEQFDQLLELSGEDREMVFSGLGVNDRLSVARELQRLRADTEDERQFEEQVELNRARKKAKHEADRRDTVEREAYLTSPEGRAEAVERFDQEFIDLDDLEDPESLIDGFLHRDTMVRTFGPPKSLKSFATLDMAACISLGLDWHGHRTTQTNVLYVVAEGVRGIKKRRDAWNEHNGAEMKVNFFPRAVQIGEPQEMYDLIAYCLARAIGYVVFDTQARCTVGVDENDNTENGVIVAALDVLKRETHACVHLVHHSVGNNENKARGATAWDGAVDAEFITKRNKDNPDLVEFVTKFQKDIGEAEKVKFVTLEVGNSLVLTLDGASASAASGDVKPALVTDANAIYLETIRLFGPGGATVSDVTADLADRGVKRSRTAVKKAFGTLLSGGAVAQTGRGTAVEVSQSGLVFLDEWRLRAPQEDAQTMIE